MTPRPSRKRAAATASVALLALGLIPAATAQTSPDKQFQIRTRTAAFVKARTVAADPGDDDLRKLRKARLNAVLNELLGRTIDFNRDGTRVDRLVDSSLRLLEAEVDYYGRAEDRAGVLEEHLRLSRELTAIIDARTEAEPDSGANREYAHYCLSSVELALLKARRETDRETDR
jgi:hypothetical protein